MEQELFKEGDDVGQQGLPLLTSIQESQERKLLLVCPSKTKRK